MPTANEIRQQFIDFFVKKHGHTFVPSAPVVPIDDPTLMFSNAGMNQFKDVFLGVGSRPYKRAVNTQKCIRASGKHNDLEDVGRDTYHHTFFEMLGNWSFGDYYKAEAIRWAWELLTEVWKIDKTRLHATVFGGDKEFGLEADDEAFKLWTKETDINPSHVHRFGKKDNFWMMGETGPCGPCSEIHIDRTPDKSGAKLVNAGDARVMEIWNLVFIQYNRDDAGKLTPLPAKHVDTGMGFERITAVLQGKDSNYDTDVFSPIMEAIGKLVGKKYGKKLDDLNDVAFRAIADHLRALTFAITDGARPDNRGRGSVLRSILRRAVRFGYQCFCQREPFIYKLVPTLVEHMGGAFPELKKGPQKVAEVIRGEEADFFRTIERGLMEFGVAAYSAIARERNRQDAHICDRLGGPWECELEPGREAIVGFSFGADKTRVRSCDSNRFRSVIQRAFQPLPTISGQDLFTLHTEDGFPPDLTRQLADELGFDVDLAGYHRLMTEHEEKSRGKDTAQQVAISTTAPLPPTDDRPKWFGLASEGKILGWIEDNQFITTGKLQKHKNVGLVLDKTCFYAEAGGQIGDTGSVKTITGTFRVTQTIKVGNAVVHLGEVTEGRIETGQSATLAVDPIRDLTRKNHTVTHLLHWALHKVLGEHVEQRGSMVNPQKLTFDFSHPTAMTAAEKARVEQLVNEKIYQDLPVTWRELPQEEAKKLPGVKAFFGDKYGETVRVVEIHEQPAAHPLTPSPSPPEGRGGQESVFSREFCGGTHLEHTGQIGFFKIVGEEATGKGVRRITAITGPEAVAHVQQIDYVLGDLLARFRCRAEDLPKRIDALQDEIKKLQQQLKKGAATDLAGAADRLFDAASDVNGAKIVIGEMPAGPDEQMRMQVDRLRQKAGSSVIVLGWADDGKVGLLAAVTDDLVKKGLHAGKLVGQIAPVVGGKGGGKLTLAQAGGKDPAKLGEALAEARKLVSESIASSV
jgi:alanyl-tRNA synthetase